MIDFSELKKNGVRMKSSFQFRRARSQSTNDTTDVTSKPSLSIKLAIPTQPRSVENSPRSQENRKSLSSRKARGKKSTEEIKEKKEVVFSPEELAPPQVVGNGISPRSRQSITKRLSLRVKKGVVKKQERSIDEEVVITRPCDVEQIVHVKRDEKLGLVVFIPSFIWLK